MLNNFKMIFEVYYNNKLGFYIKQYGTQIFAVVVCLIIIASGLFLYFKINNRNKNTVEITAQTEQTEQVILSYILRSSMSSFRLFRKTAEDIKRTAALFPDDSSFCCQYISLLF